MTPRDLARRLLSPRLRARALRLVRQSPWLASVVTEPEPVRDGYATWLARLAEASPAPPPQDAGPTISIVMPVYETPEDTLRAAIASVQAQCWTRWELCIANDASPSPHVRQVLDELAAGDNRIRVTHRQTNGHIAAASNTALATATGEFVALMDHDDLLPPEALATVAAAIARQPDVAVLFTDEDKVDAGGTRFDPYLKPGFDPDLMLGQNLVNHLAVYRRSVLEQIGGWRDGYEGSQDYDLALRAIAAAGQESVLHLPGILYHWRQAEGGQSFSQTALEQCAASGRRAVAAHLAALGVEGAVVEPAPRMRFWNRVRWPMPATPPLVAFVLMPEADLKRSLDCVRRLASASDYGVAEVLVPLPQDAVPGNTNGDAVLIPAGIGAGWAKRLNAAARAASSDILVLVGDQPAIAEPRWLSELVAQLCRHGVGAAGGPALRTASHLRHAELATDADGRIVAAYRNARRSDVGYLGGLALTRRVAALGGGCMAFRRSVFLGLGGADDAMLDEGLADADLCFRMRGQGLAVVWTPHAPLLDTGQPATPDRVSATAAAAFRQRWAEASRDPARSPLLGLRDGRPAWPTEDQPISPTSAQDAGDDTASR